MKKILQFVTKQKLTKLIGVGTMMLAISFKSMSQTPVPASVVDVIVNSPVHETLEAAVLKAELAGALSDPEGTFTVFAPTDDAFAALPEGTVEALLEDTATLKKILFYHVLGSEVLSTSLTNGTIASTLNGKSIKVTITTEGKVFINQAEVSVTDIVTGNGVVHVIDAVLLPRNTVADVAIDNGFTVLTQAVVATELLPDLTNPAGTYTVFAPTDAAFELLGEEALGELLSDPTADLKDILLYHVLGSEVESGDLTNGTIATTLNGKTVKVTITTEGKVFLNQAEITTTDIPADNGIVHVIDAVVLPVNTLADVAIDNGFSTLTTAVVAAELLPALTDPFGSYTVFAPTNAAFEALGEELLGELLADPTADLKDILLYHVVDEEVGSGDIFNGALVTTLNGNTVKVTITSEGKVYLNQAVITTTDIPADNGIVHVIDAVVLPINTVADVAIDNGFSTLTAAVVAAELLPALTNPAGTYTVFAPTDAAFEALGEELLGELLSDPTGDLKSILLYHVLGTKVMASEITNNLMVETLEGSMVEFKIMNDSVFINDAYITLTDIMADNGIVHVIDAVIVPDNLPLGIVTTDGKNKLSVYPNPIQDSKLFVSDYQNGEFTILNAQGQLITSGIYETSGIDVDNFAKGMYSIQMKTKDGVFTSKFVK